MTAQTVAASEVQQSTMTERTRHHARAVVPPVDIYETQDGLVVLVDMPGVAKEALDVRVDHNVLIIRGYARHVVPGKVPCRAYDLVNVFRQFALSDTIDQSHITVELHSGVLTVHLPKAQEAEPHQLEVHAA